MNFDLETQEELNFMGIDFEESNLEIIQDLFNSKPLLEKDGYPPKFIKWDISECKIDHTL